MKKFMSDSQELTAIRAQIKQKAELTGLAGAIQSPDFSQVELFSAMPDIDSDQTIKLQQRLEQLQKQHQNNPEAFQNKTVGTSFVFSNDGYMSDTVKVLGQTPNQFMGQNKLNIALVVGQGNFESMTVELLNHAHLVLFVDIDPMVIEYNLFSAQLLQQKEDYITGILDPKRNPILKNEVMIPQRSGYMPGQVSKVTTIPRQKCTPDYFASLFRDAASQTFDRYSLLSTKLRLFSEGNSTNGGFVILDQTVILQLNQFAKQFENNEKLQSVRGQFDALSKKLIEHINSKASFSANDALMLRNIIRDLSDNRYYLAGDFRFDVCAAASKQLQFAGLQLDIFDQQQVAALKKVFDQHNVVVSVFNVTNLYYYDNKKPYFPCFKPTESYQPDGRLLQSMRTLTDHDRTLILYSKYPNANAQFLQSELCQGLDKFEQIMKDNIANLHQQIHSKGQTSTTAKQKEQITGQYSKAIQLFKQKKYEQALEILDDITYKFDCDTAERAKCHSSMASCLRDNGQLDDALSQCELAMDVLIRLKQDVTQIKTKYSGCLQKAKPDLKAQYDKCKTIYKSGRTDFAACRLSCLIGVFGREPAHQKVVAQCQSLFDLCASKLVAELSLSGSSKIK